MGQLNARAKSLVSFLLGAALLGCTSSHFATRTAAPIEQLQRGARSYLQYAVTGYSDWAEHTGFRKWYAYGQLSTPFSMMSMCYIAPDVTNDRAFVSKVLGQEGELLQAYHESYSFVDFHLRVLTINCSVDLI